VEANKPKPKVHPKAKPSPQDSEIASPEEVQKALARAKKILLLYMPTPSKLVH